MTVNTRRMLSMDRRTGPQLPLDVSNGRTPRHAQGWKSQQCDGIEGDGLRMLRSAVIAAIAFWLAFGLVFWVVVELAR